MPGVPLWRRYARLFGPDLKADVDDELRFHLEAKVDDLVAQGWNRGAAQEEAERQFGDFKSVQEAGEKLGRERQRNMQRKDYWAECWQDIRYGFRTLRRDRSFAIITTLILGLGIAANTTVFSVVNTVLLRPLPFPDAQQLTWFTAGRSLKPAKREAAGLSGVTYTVAAFEEFQRHNRSFQSITSYNPFFASSEYTLTGRGEPEAVEGVMVAENFFQVLGLRPALGRLFLPAECKKGGKQAVLLGNAFWRHKYGGDPTIVGQTITLSKQSRTVVGVLPPTFDFGSVFSPGVNIDLYVPAVMDEIRTWGNTLAVIGRLKPGVSVAQAQAEADILFPQLRAAHKEWFTDYSSTITGLKEYVSGKLRRPLIVLWSAVGLIMLIVCVNLSNLLLARSAARSKEFAMRRALGASRARLLRQLLTEGAVLAGAGTVLGVCLAFALVMYIAHQGSIALPLLRSVRVDGAALGWTLLVAVAVSMLFGLVPGFRIAAGNIQETLKDSGQGMSAGRQHERLRGGMVISEVALACVLLVGAGLLLRSFLRVLDIDLGFQPARAATMKIDYDASDGARRGAVLEEMLRQISLIPGVESAGVADMLPLGRNRSWGFKAKGRAYAKGDDVSALVRIVTPGYLSAMGMRLQDGRDFSWQDGPKNQPVVIINRAAARRFWPAENPLGRMAIINQRDVRIIGVISDVRENSLEVSAAPEMYLPVMQADPEGAELVLRSTLPPAALSASVMRILRALNPAQPAAELRPLRHIVDRAVSPRRFFVMLVTSFAVLGLGLAAVGIYGVISYSVTRQKHEIGIRMALGATGSRVQFDVVAKALRLALIGIALGTAGSLAATKWIASLLFNMEPNDPLTFSGIIVLLAVAALVAGYIPARRASRIDPMIALRAN